MLHAGNSGTTLRLLAGILAGQDFPSTLGGDASLSRRPMDRIVRPLRLMGAEVTSGRGGVPPLRIHGGSLKSTRYELPVASAQVKSCVLLAGLYGDGITAVREPAATRDHTEIALRQFGAEVESADDWIEVKPNPVLRAQRLEVPGDLSGAAYFMVAAGLIPGSEILLRRVGLNRRRVELLRYLRKAGLLVDIEGESVMAGEPRGDLHVRYSPDLGSRPLPPIRGGDTAALIDEIPILAVLGSQAPGGIEVRDAKELRVKESDRISATVRNLCALGCPVVEEEDGFRVQGGKKLTGAFLATGGDHRIAMAFAVAGLLAEGTTGISEPESADVSFPGFWDSLQALTGAKFEVRE
jgi:3-phosphoshikimate 1-carboxyvinyltransferase